jgi:hypothetical protein
MIYAIFRASLVFLFLSIQWSCAKNPQPDAFLPPSGLPNTSLPPPQLEIDGDWIEITITEEWHKDEIRLLRDMRHKAEKEMLDVKGHSIEYSIMGIRYSDSSSSPVAKYVEIFYTSTTGRVNPITVVSHNLVVFQDRPYLAVRFRGKAVQEKSDRSFAVQCDFDGKENSIFEEGDEIALQIQSMKDAHLILIVYEIEPDSCFVLYPHEDLPYVQLEARHPIVFPPQEEGFIPLEAYSHGRDSIDSILFVLATRSKWMLPIKKTLDFDEFEAWLRKIPLSEYALTYLQFSAFSRN